MKRSCPKKLTGIDLEILAPNVLLVAHSDAQEQLWKLGGQPPRSKRRGLTVWKQGIGRNTVTVLGVDHPASRAKGGWRESWRQLAEHLNGEDPLLDRVSAA